MFLSNQTKPYKTCWEKGKHQAEHESSTDYAEIAYVPMYNEMLQISGRQPLVRRSKRLATAAPDY